MTNLLYLASSSEGLAEVTRGYLQTAETELRRASAITNQTLRFHKQSTKPIEVLCEDLIDGNLTIHRSRIVNLRVHVEKPKRAQRPVLCFGGKIRQVLANLIGNAIDAMRPAGGKLLLRSREGHDWVSGRECLVITVADTVIGIPRETITKLSTRFYNKSYRWDRSRSLDKPRSSVAIEGGLLFAVAEMSQLEAPSLLYTCPTMRLRLWSCGCPLLSSIARFPLQTSFVLGAREQSR